MMLYRYLVDLIHLTKSESQVWWYHGDRQARQWVRGELPNMILVEDSVSPFRETDMVNVQWTKLMASDVRRLQKEGLKVNVFVVSRPWLYSYYWCSGVNSVTTNHAHRLSQIPSPTYHISKWKYAAAAMSANLISFFTIVVLISLLYDQGSKGSSVQPTRGEVSVMSEVHPLMAPDGLSGNEGDAVGGGTEGERALERNNFLENHNKISH
eukprot:GHVN01033005.1.p2 GENE.GHVN01033005.1~~GHVN01033005.1.p2  ORF type:complete len:210 (+),score=49.40 GHVN01033005.1:1597-2226(+)